MGGTEAELNAVALAPIVVPTTTIDVAVLRLERWLEGMRTAGGYGGPVVHFWRDNLLFCASSIDWRYEGIVAGYLALHGASGDRRWLDRAKHAGDDVLAARLPGSTFRNSGFELNPATGGRPHEAAVDCALLGLASALRDADDPDWTRYVDAARDNVEQFLIGTLWRDDERRFADGADWFVPNKAATILEALCALAQLIADDELLVRYGRPTAEAILALQVRAPGDPLDGGIAQAEHAGTVVEQYFPYYVARAASGLMTLAAVLGDDRICDAAFAAGRFITRWRDADGAFPQVVYRAGRVNRYPRWVAGAADIVRALDLLRRHGADADPGPTLDWLMAGQSASGNFRIADGFAGQVHQRPARGAPDARDFFPVVGWNDKAFRVLAERSSGAVALDPPDEPRPARHEVSWRGRPAVMIETDDSVEIIGDGRVSYRWQKGSDWASIA